MSQNASPKTRNNTAAATIILVLISISLVTFVPSFSYIYDLSTSYQYLQERVSINLIRDGEGQRNSHRGGSMYSNSIDGDKDLMTPLHDDEEDESPINKISTTINDNDKSDSINDGSDDDSDNVIVGDDVMVNEESLVEEDNKLDENELSSTSTNDAIIINKGSIEFTASMERIALQPVEWETVPSKWKVMNRYHGKKLFVFQPSGGWGNQRYILRWAMIAANAMNRTLVLSPIAPHSDIWHRFNDFRSDQIISMAQVLDLDALQEAVINGVLAHNDTVLSLKDKYLSHLNWIEYVKPHDKDLSGGRRKWWWFPESYVKQQFGIGSSYESADVVFWKQGSMWCCCGTDIRSDSVWYGRHIMFNNHLKTLALRLMKPFGFIYNAIHVRLGDHAEKDRRNVDVYYKVHKLNKFNTSIPLYIATDEKPENLDAWFGPLRDKYGFKQLLYWRDLDRSILEREVLAYPIDMHRDILGFIEQLICGNAVMWEGSRKSTFSAAIYAIRATPSLREMKWKFPPKPSTVRGKIKK